MDTGEKATGSNIDVDSNMDYTASSLLYFFFVGIEEKQVGKSAENDKYKVVKNIYIVTLVTVILGCNSRNKVVQGAQKVVSYEKWGNFW